MRKKLLYVFITLAVVLTILYLWRYKQAQVFENRVPANATKVVNINLRQIENYLLFDFLTNPITYLKPREKKDSIDKPKTSLTKGVSIPKNILFYSNSEDLKNNWFSSIVTINDRSEFFEFLEKEKFEKNEVDSVIFYTKDNFALAIKNEQLIIALKTTKKQDVSLLLISLFDNQEFLDEDAQVLRKLIGNKNDISFSSDSNALDANFRDGIFELQGTLISDIFIANANQKPNKDGIVLLSGKINKNNTLFKQFLKRNKDKFNEITHLSLDSIVDKWDGKFNMDITSIEQKTDTIVSYEYDDDFNKVEKKATQEKKIPKLDLTLGQENPSSLSDYFYSKNAIQVIENDTIFTTIPIFKFLVGNTQDNLGLYVNQKENQLNASSTTSKLNFYFNVEKYMDKPLDIPLNEDQEDFLNLVKTANINWTEDDHFSLKINLKEKHRNFLGKFIKQ